MRRRKRDPRYVRLDRTITISLFVTSWLSASAIGFGAVFGTFEFSWWMVPIICAFPAIIATGVTVDFVKDAVNEAIED